MLHNIPVLIFFAEDKIKFAYKMSKYSFFVSFAIHFQIVSGFPKGCFLKEEIQK